MNVNLSLHTQLSQTACNWDASLRQALFMLAQFMSKYLRMHFQ